MSTNTPTQENIIDVRDLKVRLGEKWILDGINFQVKRGEVFAIVGGSGAGKSTLLHSLLMLLPATAGSIRILDKDITHCSAADAAMIRRHWGMLFQSGALFSSLSLLENVEFPLHEYTQLNADMIRDIALLKIKMAGLTSEDAIKYPAELSGGMQKRAALARAIALDPELLFLDEPTAGLDPESANALDELILNLKHILGLTVIVVTHDLDTLWHVADRVAFLGEGKVLELGTMKELTNSKQPLVRAYFNGRRGLAAAREQ